jgi:hypothetical protein
VTKFSAISSWLSSIACGVCLVLAVLATPGVARADPDCSCCGTDPGSGNPSGHYTYMMCMQQCTQAGGCAFLGCNSFCAVVCGPFNGGPASGIQCTGNCSGTGCHFGCGCSFVNGCNECG